jgi:hypothetical protein
MNGRADLHRDAGCQERKAQARRLRRLSIRQLRHRRRPLRLGVFRSPTCFPCLPGACRVPQTLTLLHHPSVCRIEGLRLLLCQGWEFSAETGDFVWVILGNFGDSGELEQNRRYRVEDGKLEIHTVGLIRFHCSLP